MKLFVALRGADLSLKKLTIGGHNDIKVIFDLASDILHFFFKSENLH